MKKRKKKREGSKVSYLFIGLLFIGFISFAQEVTIEGIVTSDDGLNLPGVNILLKGTNKGTQTDFNGNYILNANSQGILVFSYIGYVTQEIVISNKTTINVTLITDTQSLDEIVIVGYGEQQRSDLTGAIGSIKSEGIKDKPIVDINQAMMGRIAGVNVMNNSGAPGGSLDIQIRGLSTIGSSANPLYVIDGTIIQTSMDSESSPLSFINPSDIESIDILKDASAAAIYGARGSNGVVVITTKSGKIGKAKFNYTLKTGLQHVFNSPEVLSGKEYAYLSIEARNNAWVADGNSAYDSDNLRPDNLKIGYFQDFLDSGKQGTDWQDAIFTNALFQDHQLTLSGGSDHIKYLFSGSFLNNEGILKNTGFKRYSFRSNVEAKLSEKWEVGIKLNPTFTNQDYLPATGRFNAQSAGIIQSALLINPMLEIYDEESYTGYSTGIGQIAGIQSIENPVAKVDMIKDNRRNFVFVSNGFAKYDISKAFDFKLTAGAIIRSVQINRIIPSTLGSFNTIAPSQNSIFNRQGTNYNWQTSLELSYNQRFGKHHVSGVAVHEKQMQQSNDIITEANATWTDEIITVDGNLPNVLREGQSSISEWAISSWIGRLNYNFDNKYILTGSIRADGSSRFANKWGVFPAGAVAWKVSNESFLKKQRWLNQLKFRASYGLTGNNSIGDYAFMSFMGGSSAVLGVGGESITSGVSLNTYGNPDLTWEKTAQFDVGVDIELFKKRLSLTLDYYNKQTNDLLLGLQTPANMGFTSILTNIGNLENKGFEFSLDSRNLSQRFKWNTNFNISFNRQKVKKLGPEGDPLWGDALFLSNSHITKIGEPMGLFYGLKVIGIYQNQDQVDELPGITTGAGVSRPGEFIFEDVNGDNEITIEDRTIIGNPHPDFVFGFSNSFSYKRFSLDVTLRGSYGQDVLNLNYANVPHTLRTNVAKRTINRWQSESQPGNGEIPRLATNGNAVLGSTTLNSYYVEKANFINIQNVNIGYSMPKEILKNLNVDRLGFSLNINNLYMFTDYTGYNPEGGIDVGSSLSPGLDWGKYPLSRTFTFGIDVTF